MEANIPLLFPFCFLCNVAVKFLKPRNSITALHHSTCIVCSCTRRAYFMGISIRAVIGPAGFLGCLCAGATKNVKLTDMKHDMTTATDLSFLEQLQNPHMISSKITKSIPNTHLWNNSGILHVHANLLIVTIT